jgi:hypothetical protein
MSDPLPSASKDTETRPAPFFPAIPAIPSSLSTITEKENQRQAKRPGHRLFHISSPSSEISFGLHHSSPLPPKKQQSSSTLHIRRPSHIQQSSHAESDHDRSFSSPSFPTLHSSSTSLLPPQQRRVLRYGETMEALFGLDSSCNDEHWKLCRSIVDGSAADDAAVWRRVLELASIKTAASVSNISSSATGMSVYFVLNGSSWLSTCLFDTYSLCYFIFSSWG